MHTSDDKITASTFDALMQDTWLLALAIRNNPPVVVDDALYQRCFGMIQQVQKELSAAGVADPLIEEITFAHCTFLDEAVMTQPDTDVSTWWSRTPLKGHFLGHIHGGDRFYEQIKKHLREPNPPKVIVTCYYRMLQLGYVGKYTAESDAERQSLLQGLATLLPGVPKDNAGQDIVVVSGGKAAQWWQSRWVILFLLLLLSTGIWVGLTLFLLTQ